MSCGIWPTVIVGGALLCVLAIPIWNLVQDNRRYDLEQKTKQQIEAAKLAKEKPWLN